MNDFTILHLSDLHIDVSGEQLPVLLENLLDDIEREMIFSDHIVLIVTGDIVHKANYKNSNCAISFFRKLKEKIGKKIREVYIVPGNHDKSRNILDEKIIKNYKPKNKNFYANEWKYVRMAFDEYTELSEKIYEIFYDNKEKVTEKIFRDTFGVRIDEINGKRICFLLLNTAWSCMGDTDERHLRIGQFQIEKIKEQYDTKRALLEGKEIDLTIALAHHPVSWLKGKDENLLQKMLLADDGVKANIYICGHIHDRDVINWQNNRHSLTTLVSGIGWPDGMTEHPYAHTYSSYVFNLDLNSIDVYVRSSDDASIFEPDFRIYTQERNKKENKIIMPINSCRTQAYYKLGAVNNRSQKGCYITESFLEDLRKFVELVANIRSDVLERLINLKLDIYDNLGKLLDNKKVDFSESRLLELEDFWFRDSEKDPSFEDILVYVQEEMMQQFLAYLAFICIKLHNWIVGLNEGADIRVHFRVLKVEKDTCIKDKCIYHNVYFHGHGKDKQGKDEHIMHDLEYGELLKESYKAKRPLIASANTYYCKSSIKRNKENESGHKWNDFITIIPNFSSNSYTMRNKKTDEIILDCPLLTYGVTIYREEDQKILYLLDYLRFDILIGKMIQDFLFNMPIDLKEFVDWYFTQK